MLNSSWNEYGRIKRIALRHPENSFRSQAYLESQWKNLNYHSMPDYAKAQKEYETFVNILADHNIKIDFLPSDDSLSCDSIYVRDASVITPHGILLTNMGKAQRKCEPAINGRGFKAVGLPIVGEITGDGSLEGGDLIWIDSNTLAVARGYRTNDAGIEQLKSFLPKNVNVITVPLPHYKGPSDVFHLMSIISPIDKDLMLVYSPLMSIPFREWLVSHNYNLVEVPNEEFDSMGCNVLAIAPRVAIMVKGNPKTRAALEKAGTKVYEIDGWEISRKGEGGPTCLTRPLIRE